MRTEPVDDPGDGLYQKYYVIRYEDPTGKHQDCFYFVLDPRHDVHAAAALKFYADSVRAEHPGLAADLDERLEKRVL